MDVCSGHLCCDFLAGCCLQTDFGGQRVCAVWGRQIWGAFALFLTDTSNRTESASVSEVLDEKQEEDSTRPTILQIFSLHSCSTGLIFLK